MSARRVFDGPASSSRVATVDEMLLLLLLLDACRRRSDHRQAIFTQREDAPPSVTVAAASAGRHRRRRRHEPPQLAPEHPVIGTGSCLMFSQPYPFYGWDIFCFYLISFLFFFDLIITIRQRDLFFKSLFLYSFLIAGNLVFVFVCFFFFFLSD